MLNVKVIAGIDGGNNTLKLWLELQKDSNVNAKAEPIKCITIDNIFCNRDDVTQETNYKLKQGRGVLTNPKVLSKMLDVSITSKDEKEGFKFLLGDVAKLDQANSRERANNWKSEDKQLARNIIVAIANAIVSNLDESILKEGIDEIEVTVVACTGLPFHEFSVDNTVEDYVRKIEGNHVVEFLNPQYPVKKVNVNVERLFVEIEGLAALRQTHFNLKILNQKSLDDLINRVSCMVDIGSGTTDIAGGIFVTDFDDDGNEKIIFEPNGDLCKGIVQGVGNPMDYTIKILQKENQKLLGQNGKITRKQILEAYLSESKNIPGLGLSIEPYFSAECERFGKDIAERFVETFNASGYKANMFKIFLSGGGSLINEIVTSFKNTLDECGYDSEKVVIIDNPVYANATGYFNIAKSRYAKQKKSSK